MQFRSKTYGSLQANAKKSRLCAKLPLEEARSKAGFGGDQRRTPATSATVETGPRSLADPAGESNAKPRPDCQRETVRLALAVDGDFEGSLKRRMEIRAFEVYVVNVFFSSVQADSIVLKPKLKKSVRIKSRYGFRLKFSGPD